MSNRPDDDFRDDGHTPVDLRAKLFRDREHTGD
jgi:hypothetical protein